MPISCHLTILSLKNSLPDILSYELLFSNKLWRGKVRGECFYFLRRNVHRQILVWAYCTYHVSLTGSASCLRKSLRQIHKWRKCIPAIWEMCLCLYWFSRFGCALAMLITLALLIEVVRSITFSQSLMENGNKTFMEIMCKETIPLIMTKCYLKAYRRNMPVVTSHCTSSFC